MTFIGESVTVGFGYCGIAENAPHVSCGPNQEMANSWYFGDSSLSDCAPPDAPALPTNACSNDNDKPWDAGPWQPGPLAPTISSSDHTHIAQWDQAVAVGSAVNDKIRGAVVQAQDWAKNEWPGTSRYQDPAWTKPDETEWGEHQPRSHDGSWIFLNDTWIHPNKEGAAQLAGPVTKAMCSDFHHWCGEPPVWG